MCFMYVQQSKNGMLSQPHISRHVDKTNPLVKQGDEDCSTCDGIPRHTLILESLIESEKRVRSEAFHNNVIDNYGDNDVSKEQDELILF